MTFLSMAFLAALPLVAAPILLHLFDRRRNVVIEWGAMDFLLEASTKRTSARKLKQLLLLLLRVLAVAALVLALARPMLPGNWIGSSDHSELLVIVDNSMSMQRDAAGEILFNQAMERIREELQALNTGDTVRILAASPYPVWTTPGALRIDVELSEHINSQLTNIQPTNGTSDLLAALFTAVQSAPDPSVKQRKIIVVTDGQASDWKASDEKGWNRFQDVLKNASLPTNLNVIKLDTGLAETSNVAVSEVRSSRTVVGVGQPFTVTAHVRNFSPISTGSRKIRWLVNSVEEDNDLIPEISGGEAFDPIWHHFIDAPGVYAVSCEVDAGDPLQADNHGTVVIEVVDEVPVLLVESAAGRAEIQQDSYFLQAAMGYPDGQAVDSRGVHRPEVVSPVGLERADLGSFSAVVIPNLQTLSEDTVEKLHEYVFNGGGLWLAAGPRTDVEAFNDFVFNGGDGLSPLPFEGVVAESSENGRSTTINPTLRDHPATRELGDTSRLDTADVRIHRRMRFVPPAQQNDVSVLLSLTNGEPLAVEKYVGRGRVIVMATPLRLDQWTEFARADAFVVMVQDWLSYLTQPQSTRYNLFPGDPITVMLADAEHTDATLRTPHGDEIALAADAMGDGSVFRSSRTILPGDYSLELNLTGDQLPFHVFRNGGESDLTGLNPEEERLLANTAGLKQNLLGTNLSGTAQSDPIWPLLLILLIVFMTGELLLSGSISRERFGSATISETSEEFGHRAADMPLRFGSESKPAESNSDHSSRKVSI